MLLCHSIILNDSGSWPQSQATFLPARCPQHILWIMYGQFIIRTGDLSVKTPQVGPAADGVQTFWRGIDMFWMWIHFAFVVTHHHASSIMHMHTHLQRVSSEIGKLPCWSYPNVLGIQAVLTPGWIDATVQVRSRPAHVQFIFIRLCGNVIPGIIAWVGELQQTVKMSRRA